MSQKILRFLLPINLCTDNGAMVAWAGMKIQETEFSNSNFKPKAKWPIFLARLHKIYPAIDLKAGKCGNL